MFFQSAFLTTALLIATGAAAADVAAPTVTDSKPKPVARRVLAPSVHVMRATRQPDGSLTMDCVQRPNPLLIKPGALNSPRRNGGEP